MRRVLLAMLLIFSSHQLFAQIKSHQIGRLWTTLFEVGTLPDYAPLQNQMTYPGGDFFLHTRKHMEETGLWIGVRDWTDKFGQFRSYYVSEGGYLNQEAADYLKPIQSRKYVRQRLPLVDVNEQREQRILDNRQSSYRLTSLDSDEQISMKWATDVGLEVTVNSYAFANRFHDQYVILEYEFTNTGDVDGQSPTEYPNQNLTGIYFGFWRSFIPSGDIGHEQMGGQHDDWCHYYGNQVGDTLRGFWYTYDGDGDRRAFDDVGDPSEVNGEFLSTSYPAFGVLHADTDHTDETDDRSQPATVNFWPRSRVHSHTKGDPEQTLYFDLSSNEQSRGSDTGDYADPYNSDIQHPDVLLSFGPYDLPFGETIRIVLFEAIGSIDRSEAINYGKQHFNNTLEWNGLTGDGAKNALIATGLDSLHQIVHRAEWTWANGYAAVPDGPGAPNLRIQAGPGKVDLEWYYGNYGTHDTTPPDGDNDTDVYDFAGYRVYRAEESYLNPYRMIFECGGNSGVPVTNIYTDRDVERGQSYFYYVVAFDDGTQNTSPLSYGKSLGSSHFSNRNYQYAAIPFVGAFTRLDSIYVVPNPFHAQGLEYGGTFREDYIIEPDIGARIEDRITFVGLPAKAMIRIFTAHGDLVATLEHPDPFNPRSVPESADEMWFQISDSYQTIKSGVYFYHVEGWDRHDNFLGTATGKFIVIR
jgi:hypothetical protein